jgi:hypothetical protein
MIGKELCTDRFCFRWSEVVNTVRSATQIEECVIEIGSGRFPDIEKQEQDSKKVLDEIEMRTAETLSDEMSSAKRQRREKALPIPSIPLTSSKYSNHPPIPASRLFSSSSWGEGGGGLVSSKMTFNVGRRLQQLTIQNNLQIIVSELKSKIKPNSEQRGILIFPCVVSLLASTGVAEAFTEVPKFIISLCLTPTLFLLFV